MHEDMEAEAPLEDGAERNSMGEVESAATAWRVRLLRARNQLGEAWHSIVRTKCNRWCSASFSAHRAAVVATVPNRSCSRASSRRLLSLHGDARPAAENMAVQAKQEDDLAKSTAIQKLEWKAEANGSVRKQNGNWNRAAAQGSTWLVLLVTPTACVMEEKADNWKALATDILR